MLFTHALCGRERPLIEYLSGHFISTVAGFQVQNVPFLLESVRLRNRLPAVPAHAGQEGLMVCSGDSGYVSIGKMLAWNKGLTKDTHPALRKTSETMRRKGIDNFKNWRDGMKHRGLIKSSYPPLVRNGDLAELLGTVLGDGHLHTHDRCDSLRIVGDARKIDFVVRSAHLIHSVFKKHPKVAKRKSSNGVNITLYEKNIARRLNIPTGARAQHKFLLPVWIEKNRQHTIRFLRGLYEAEGSLSHSPATYTHKFIFSNMNPHLLELVARLVRGLGFTVSNSANKIQVSRKDEVQKLSDLLEFRHYES